MLGGTLRRPYSILILNERDPRNPLAGGAEVHTFEVFGRLAAKGHEVTLLAAAFPGCVKEEVVDGIRVKRLSNRYLYYALVPFAARREVRAGRGDVVVDVLCKLPFLSPWLVPAPCVAVVHHLFGTTAFQQVPFPVALATWLSEKLIPFAYKKTLCISVSPSTRDDMLERGLDADTQVVVPNGVDRGVYNTGDGSAKDEKLIVWLGRAEPYKRVDVLLHAVSKLRNDLPGLRLAIVGEGGAVKQLRTLSRNLGVDDIVEFKGFVSGDLKVGLLRQAAVIANTSEKEGWGLTVIEGNACGTPTVASNVPGLRDSVVDGETGMLVAHADVDALAAALSAILTDDRLRERLSANALEWAARFDWDNSAVDIERMMEEVIAGKDPREIRPHLSPFS